MPEDEAENAAVVGPLTSAHVPGLGIRMESGTTDA